MHVEVIPTVVPASWDDVVAAASRCAFAGALHVDFADGLFAPNTTWLPDNDSTHHAPSGMLFEAHLMVQEPQEIGLLLARMGFARIIGHVEALANPPGALAAWRGSGVHEVGLGMLADTPLAAIDPFAASIDMVQMMTISKIGVQGLPFDERAPSRVAQLHASYPDLLISVDGSVNEKTIVPLAEGGARRFCAGSVLSKSADLPATYRSLMSLAESGIMAAHDH